MEWQRPLPEPIKRQEGWSGPCRVPLRSLELLGTLPCKVTSWLRRKAISKLESNAGPRLTSWSTCHVIVVVSTLFPSSLYNPYITPIIIVVSFDFPFSQYFPCSRGNGQIRVRDVCEGSECCHGRARRTTPENSTEQDTCSLPCPAMLCICMDRRGVV